jgi:hypothetical protein
MKKSDSNVAGEAALESPVDELQSYIVDKDLEKTLLRKFDLHILPLLAVMYLFKYVTKLRSSIFAHKH